jgi:hypothetical protein
LPTAGGIFSGVKYIFTSEEPKVRKWLERGGDPMPEQSHAPAVSAHDVCPLLPGTPVPEVAVRTIDGSEVNLAHLVRERPAVLVFYRGGW